MLGLILGPDVYLPLDIVEGLTVVGSVNGTLVGDGVQIAGKDNNGLELRPDAYVDMELQNEDCLADISLCTNGFTYSLWLFLSPGSFDSYEDRHILYSGRYGEEVMLEIIHSDGYDFNYVSVDMYHENRRITNSPDILDGRWVHVVFSWSMSSDLNTYINGCKDNQWLSHEDGDWESYNDTSAFYIGRQPEYELTNFHIKVDEMNVWYEVLTDEEVWHLYLQGGIIP